MNDLIVYERSSDGWGAYAPDLPVLGVVGRTLKETKRLIREAIEFHLEDMRRLVIQFQTPIHKQNRSTWREPAVELPCNELKAESWELKHA